jgi:antitoxin component YwqK of YwqJK toxin-antitoxin module
MKIKLIDNINYLLIGMEEIIQCYICYENETINNMYLKEVRPCKCKGSIVIHKKCLDTVIKTSRICTICKTRYNLTYLPQKNGRELIIEKSNYGEIIEYTINDKGEKHGTYIIKNLDGRTLILHSYINGIMEGPYVEYYQNGQIKSVCKCRNNRIEGEYCEWYEDGSILEESTYKNGLKHGECIKWVREYDIKIIQTIQYDEGNEIY